MIVLDASVLLKWFLREEEEDRPQALLFQKSHVEGEEVIAVPDLVFYEIANVLVIRTSLSQSEIQENLHQLRACNLESFEFSQLTGIVEIARHHGITVYDAAYVALARSLRCRFVTADERLLSRLKTVPHAHSLREVKP